jgi:hypothetical protein
MATQIGLKSRIGGHIKDDSWPISLLVFRRILNLTICGFILVFIALNSSLFSIEIHHRQQKQEVKQ